MVLPTFLHQFMLESLEDADPRWPFYFRRIQGTVLDQADPSQRNTSPCSQTPSCTYGYFPISNLVIKRLYENKNLKYDDKAKHFLSWTIWT